MKICSRCKKEKYLDEFGDNKWRLDGKQSGCRACAAANRKYNRTLSPEKTREANRRWREKNPDYHNKLKERDPDNYWRRTLKRKYNLTPEDYYTMLSNQNGVCAICRMICTTGKKLCVDHNHTTNKVRGLLCHRCNTSLGGFGDTSKLLVIAIEYLQEFDTT